jgi:hypothetical protein
VYASPAFRKPDHSPSAFVILPGSQSAPPIETMAKVISNTIKALIIGFIVFSFSI